MEFHEKLQLLRTNENLTQEELAEKLYVSRTAISKWESGRGYPSIDSLKAIAKYFHVTIDELIGGEEIVTLAQEDVKNSRKRYTVLTCGILDCLIVLLFFLPIFGDSGAGSVTSVTMAAMTGIETWLKVVFFIITGLTVLNGFCTVVLSNFDNPLWNRHRAGTGVMLSVIGTVLFILTRQPYAGIVYLCLLVIKGFLYYYSLKQQSKSR